MLTAMRKSLTIKAILSFVSLILFSAVSVSAQSEDALRQYFEGREVYLKIDMPATKDGVNIYTNKEVQFDFGQYSSRLREYGTSIYKGDAIMITKIKIKGNHIEFQLGGGGYGVAGDETAYVSPKTTPKYWQEYELERQLRNETDKDRRRRLQRELWYWQNLRAEQDRRYRLEAEALSEIKRQRIEEKALRSGSRFNIHFDKKLDKSQITPEFVMNALERYVNFDENSLDYSESPE